VIIDRGCRVASGRLDELTERGRTLEDVYLELTGGHREGPASRRAAEAALGPDRPRALRHHARPGGRSERLTRPKPAGVHWLQRRRSGRRSSPAASTETTPQPLTRFSFDCDYKLDWASDGRQLAFIHNADIGPPGDSANIATIRPDGTGLRVVTNHHGGQVNAFVGSYSPDGRWIAFRLEDHGRFGLFTMHPDGTAARDRAAAMRTTAVAKTTREIAELTIPPRPPDEPTRISETAAAS
jgi:hypothetical protein